MSLIQSNMIPLLTKAVDFSLPDVLSNKNLSLKDIQGDKGTLVMFICNHCPYVIHVIEEIVNITTAYKEKNISFVAINSNDIQQYPEDNPENMKIYAKKYGFNFPYLYDESQEIAKAYQAACTPDFYLFDKTMKCIYRGQFDDSRPGNNIPVTGKDMKKALDYLINNRKIDFVQKPSIGCNIKWKNL